MLFSLNWILIDNYKFKIGDFLVEDCSASCSCSRLVRLLFWMSFNSFLIVSPCELQSVDERGLFPLASETRRVDGVDGDVSDVRGDWLRPSVISKRNACFEGVLSTIYNTIQRSNINIKRDGSWVNYRTSDALLELTNSVDGLASTGEVLSSLDFRFSSWSNELVRDRLAFLKIVPELRSKYWLRNSCLKCFHYSLVLFIDSDSRVLTGYTCSLPCRGRETFVWPHNALWGAVTIGRSARWFLSSQLLYIFQQFQPGPFQAGC